MIMDVLFFVDSTQLCFAQMSFHSIVQKIKLIIKMLFKHICLYFNRTILLL